MKIDRIYAVYFSATFSTKRIVRHIVGSFGTVGTEIDITERAPDSVAALAPTDLLVVGVPVYGGRVPAMAAERLNMLKGSRTPALIVCVYGNRDYDDALLELNDLVINNGFIPFAAAAIVAEHCIFPKVAANRPDAADMAKIDDFCQRAQETLGSFCPDELGGLTIKGKRPYKEAGAVPLHPSAGDECDGCGTCAALCPTGAILPDDLKNTDKSKCIACARCISVCPRQARRFRGVMYKAAGLVFINSYARRREPEFILSRESVSDCEYRYRNNQ